jgi:hypothetical protein
MSGHNIDDLIRTINPDTFSEAAHGGGYRILVSDNRAALYKPSLFGRLLGKRLDRHCFVKKWSVPKTVKDWTFHWSEGTSAISLDFDASFVIQANEDVQALRLAEALLASSDDAGETLHGLINAKLHEELAQMLRKCDSQALSLLDEFRRSSIGVGESETLNRAVSDAVREKLGGASFRIGFQLKNVPPMLIEVRNADQFTLADSKQPRKAETTALLQLDNYQAYKKSGLDTEAAVRTTIERTITHAVKQLLFARKYYDVVRSFAHGAHSIAAQMEAGIQADAQSIGYRLKMFQTFPDIAALKLLEPMRIDIPAGDEKYYLVNSTGYVQVSVALSVKVATDFSKLHLLIEPDARDVAEPIAARVRQITRDTIQRFDRKAFNLGFDAQIVPTLREAMVDGLGGYGLAVEVINVVQLPTEEATRFMAIRGRSIDFKAEISPQADSGDGDPVPVVGTIEVTGMTEDGWSQFESKDFGFRQDTHWSDARLRQNADRQNVSLPSQTPLPRDERRALAIELELAEIRDRVVGTLQGSMSMGPELALHWTNWTSSSKISSWAQEMAERAIASEFGLLIALRSFRRLDTQAEATLKLQREAKHVQLREVALESARKEIEHQERLRGVVDKNQVELLERYGQLERNTLEDESDPRHQTVRDRIAVEGKRLDDAQRRLGSEAHALLPAKRKPAAGHRQLPWENQDSPADTVADGGNDSGVEGSAGARTAGTPPGAGSSGG